MLDEVWKPIENYEGFYEVSNLGRIKTVEHRVVNPAVLGDGNTRRVPPMIRKPNIMKGYHCVSLVRDGKYKVFRIHRLVIEHFGSKAPSPIHQVNHIDGDKGNNRIDNLEWVTPKENTNHAIETGLRKRHPTAKTLKKMSAASKERWQDEDYRNFQTEMMANVWKERKRRGWTSWKAEKRNPEVEIRP